MSLGSLTLAERVAGGPYFLSGCRNAEKPEAQEAQKETGPGKGFVILETKEELSSYGISPGDLENWGDLAKRLNVPEESLKALNPGKEKPSDCVVPLWKRLLVAGFVVYWDARKYNLKITLPSGAAKPTITSIVLSEGKTEVEKGGFFEIKGSNLGTDDKCKVSVGGKKAGATSWSDTLVVAQAPNLGKTGKYPVKIDCVVSSNDDKNLKFVVPARVIPTPVVTPPVKKAPIKKPTVKKPDCRIADQRAILKGKMAIFRETYGGFKEQNCNVGEALKFNNVGVKAYKGTDCETIKSLNAAWGQRSGLIIGRISCPPPPPPPVVEELPPCSSFPAAMQPGLKAAEKCK